MDLTQDPTGAVSGTTTATDPDETTYFVIESLTGQFSGGVLTFQNVSILAQNQYPGTVWCIDNGQLTLSSEGTTLSGSWQSNTPNCVPGEITVSRTSGKTLGSCPYPGAASCGDPVDIGSGNVAETVTDYETAGQNRLQFVRYYNSLAAATTFAVSLGSHWRSTYDRYLNVSTSTVTAERADGQQLTFTLKGGVWKPDTDVDITLTKSGTTWTLTDHNDTVEIYTAIGSGNEALLDSITARNGYTQTMAYNASNQLESVTDSYKRSLALSYDGTLLDTVTTPDGLVLSYGYNSSGVTPGMNDRLASVSYSTSPITHQSYVYEIDAVPFGLTGIIDENGKQYATWSYDTFARGLTSQHGADANLTTVSYDDTTGDRTVTNALGEEEIYKFKTLQGVPKVIEIDRQATATTSAASRVFAYDANGYTARQTDWNGDVTKYTNDAHGDPLVIDEAVGTPQARATTITYNKVFVHLPHEIVTPELTTSYTYDGNGNPLTKTLTDSTAHTAPYSTQGQTRTWKYTWTNFLLVSIENPLGGSETTNFTYDASGALVAAINALGQKTQITKHLPGGLPQTIVDPNGVTTNLAYTPRLWLAASAVTTSAGALTTAFTYDAAANVIKVTLPDGSALTNGYDSAHRLVTVTDLFNQSIDYTLDALGDRTLTQVSNSAVTLEQQHSGVFDALGRMLKNIGGVGQTTQYAYDNNGNALSVTDPLAHVTKQTFDALNRLTRVKQPSPVGGAITTTYDPHDRPLTITDPNGSVTRYVYDGFGDLIQQSSPDSGKTIYYYNADGELTKKEDARGVVTKYAYDVLDRLLTTKYPADPTEDVTYTYDQSGHGFGVGRLTSVADAAGTLSRSYDERGNILSETREGESATGTLLTSYTYDATSRISSITYPSGSLIFYRRDSMGRITSISAKKPGSSTPVTVLSNVLYQPFGPVNALAFGNGVTETRAFDLDYRMTSLVDAGSSMLQKLGYGYDAADDVLSITDGVASGNSQAFGYDVLNRLTSADGSYGSLAYSYDPVGNILKQTAGSVATTYKYQAHSNRLTQIDAGKTKQTVGTTADGNIDDFTPPLGSVTALIYNKANRLAEVKDKAETLAQYTYDAFGQRLVKTTSVPTIYGYDLGGHLLEESIVSQITDYIYLDGRPVATITPSSGVINFLLDDRLGTPQLAVDTGEVPVWSITYQPYGLTGVVNGSITQNLRLPGQYADAESGFSYNGFRDYASNLGRYIQSDPIGITGGLNAFGYARENPVNNIDFYGTDCSSAHGLTTCSTSNYVVSFPTPTGWQDFTSQSPNYHSYSISTTTQTTGPALQQWLIANPTPAPAQHPATPTGTQNDATPIIGGLTACPNISPVQSYTTTNQLNGQPVVVNATDPDHPLFPGIVVREGDGTTINNYGEGTSYLQSPSTIGGEIFGEDINGVWTSATPDQ
jgi:RHS repeat-associated protein